MACCLQDAAPGVVSKEEAICLAQVYGLESGLHECTARTFDEWDYWLVNNVREDECTVMDGHRGGETVVLDSQTGALHSYGWINVSTSLVCTED